MSKLKCYHVRIPLGDPGANYTLWETINAAPSFQEALLGSEAQLKLYVGLLRAALKAQQKWEIFETEQPFTCGSWPGLKMQELQEWKQHTCGECKFWNYGYCHADNRQEGVKKDSRWWHARACKEFVDAS